ncbi:MAG: hypothetical protein IKU06_06380 [Lachnospiraceae bacterium]|nr:hypothetical protein [Lachnospiraceae bacterium]
MVPNTSTVTENTETVGASETIGGESSATSDTNEISLPVVKENKDGSVTTKTVSRQENGNVTDKEVTEFSNGSKIIREETKEANGTVTINKNVSEVEGLLEKIVKIKNPDGSVKKTERKYGSNGDFTEKTIIKEANGEKTTFTFASKDGKEAILQKITSSSNIVRIPDEVISADGISQPVLQLSAGIVPKSTISIKLGSKVVVIKKNALRGRNKLISLTVYAGTNLGRDSLKNTGSELVIYVIVPKNATKQERVAAKESIQNQLKKAGNSKATVKIIKE